MDVVFPSIVNYETGSFQKLSEVHLDGLIVRTSNFTDISDRLGSCFIQLANCEPRRLQSQVLQSELRSKCCKSLKSEDPRCLINNVLGPSINTLVFTTKLREMTSIIMHIVESLRKSVSFWCPFSTYKPFHVPLKYRCLLKECA